MSAPMNPAGPAVAAGGVGTYASEIASGHAAGSNGAARQDKKMQEVRRLVGELNNSMKLTGTKLSFSVDTLTNQTVVRVVDSESGELIRQIPSEAMLKLAQNITALLGVLLDSAV